MLALWLAEQPLKLYQLTSCVYWKGRVQFSHSISQIVKDFVSMFWPLPIVIESKMYNRHFNLNQTDITSSGYFLLSFERYHLTFAEFLNSDSEEGPSETVWNSPQCLNALCFQQILSRKVITAFFPLSLQLHTA